MASESDRILIQQIRQGDPRAWEHLIARYEGRLLAFINRRLRDRTASEDVVQDTLIGFLHSLPNFDDNRELQTYLFTIASYKLTDHLRKQGRHPVQYISDSSSDVLHRKLDSNLPASSVARGRERQDLETEAIARSLTTLIEHWREQGEYVRIKVLELLLVKGWANRDVAAFLQISEQQVANIRFAAVKKISEHIKNAGLPDDVFPELNAEDQS